uniref:Uncharacterized protein n=1 Tax=Solanum lycopersicum TaxID=4081 RepID=A0A3Q7HXI1_SOLLC
MNCCYRNIWIFSFRCSTDLYSTASAVYCPNSVLPVQEKHMAWIRNKTKEPDSTVLRLVLIG